MMFRDMMKCVCGMCCAAVVMCGDVNGTEVKMMDIDKPIVKMKSSGTACGILNDLVRQVREKHHVPINKYGDDDKEVLANDKKMLDALFVEGRNIVLRGDVETFKFILFFMTCVYCFDYCHKWEVEGWSYKAYIENEKEIAEYSRKKTCELTTFLLEEREAPGLVLSENILPDCEDGCFSSSQLEKFVNLLKPGKGSLW
jgi:hypothetical protein